jgi:hypothetical protein
LAALEKDYEEIASDTLGTDKDVGLEYWLRLSFVIMIIHLEFVSLQNF